MYCKVCGKPIDPKYYLCYHCYLLKQRGGIVKCHQCGKWGERSKQNHYLCSECSSYKYDESLQLKPSTKHVIKDETGYCQKISTMTEKLREIHRKHHLLKKEPNKHSEQRKRYYHTINKRDKHKQCVNHNWADGGNY